MIHRAQRASSASAVPRGVEIVAILCISVLLVGCQGFVQPTPPPTPTAVFLAGGAEVKVTQPAQAASTPIPAPAIPIGTPVSSGAVSGAASTATVSPARIMAVGVRPSLVLRALPQADAPVVATLPGSQVVWADGRSSDGRWLHVAFGDAGGRAWLSRGDATLFGEVEELAQVEPETAIAPVPTAPPARESRPVLPGLTGHVAGNQVNVRRGPGLDQAVLGQVIVGQSVAAIGRSREGDWLAISWDEATGWIAARYVELNGNAVDLPVLADQTSGAVALAAPTGSGGISQGKVVFQTATGGDIYIVNADGSGLRRLTDGIDPVLSPDGTRVAYARWGAPHGVFILDLRSGQEQRLASVNQPRGPTWSPDGSRLAFTHVTRTRICVDLGFACVDPEALPGILGGSGCIDTPQGRRCAGDFPMVKMDDNGLAVADLSKGTRQNLISEGTIQSAQWRPGQDQILFRGKQGLGIIRPGEQPSPLGNDPSIGSPAWSPDGQRILAQMRINDRNEVVLLDAAGAVVKYLTQPPPTYERPGRPAPNNVAPAWSPDGQAVLFLSDRDGAWRLYIMNTDGSEQRLFLPDVIGQLPLRYDFAAERMVNWGK